MTNSSHCLLRQLFICFGSYIKKDPPNIASMCCTDGYLRSRPVYSVVSILCGLIRGLLSADKTFLGPSLKTEYIFWSSAKKKIYEFQHSLKMALSIKKQIGKERSSKGHEYITSFVCHNHNHSLGASSFWIEDLQRYQVLCVRIESGQGVALKRVRVFFMRKERRWQ